MRILLITGLTALFAGTLTHSFGQCPADYTGDGVINISDLTLFQSDYALGQNCIQCDLNGDGIVNTQDNTLFQGLFGTSCSTIPTDCSADYNDDGIISTADLSPFISDYSLGANCVQCDLNGDGNVNQQDVLTFQGLLGSSCSTTPPPCVGDYNGDGLITVADHVLFINDYTLGANCAQCDINGDGVTSPDDLTAFKEIFGTTCVPEGICPDYNGDGMVSVSDLTLFQADYSLGQNCTMCDINNDGVIEQQDYNLFISLFGTNCNNSKNLVLNELTTPKVELTVYPNPAADIVFIELNDGTEISAESNLQVIDVSGRIIETLDFKVNNGSIHLNVMTFEPGTYLLSIVTNETLYKSKVIIK